jgi:hypothetical protein
MKEPLITVLWIAGLLLFLTVIGITRALQSELELGIWPSVIVAAVGGIIVWRPLSKKR